MPAASIPFSDIALESRADGSAGRKARLDRAFRRARESLTRRAAALADARKRKQ
jgi:hypothetical protein